MLYYLGINTAPLHGFDLSDRSQEGEQHSPIAADNPGLIDYKTVPSIVKQNKSTWIRLQKKFPTTGVQQRDLFGRNKDCGVVNTLSHSIKKVNIFKLIRL